MLGCGEKRKGIFAKNQMGRDEKPDFARGPLKADSFSAGRDGHA